jgi:hypothetical protein
VTKPFRLGEQPRYHPAMLTLRPTGQNDYNIKEGGQTKGRIRDPPKGRRLWNIQVHVTGGLPQHGVSAVNEQAAVITFYPC